MTGEEYMVLQTIKIYFTPNKATSVSIDELSAMTTIHKNELTGILQNLERNQCISQTVLKPESHEPFVLELKQKGANYVLGSDVV